MRASVVIRSKDEADRLRLTLASLAHPDAPAEIRSEIVVVDDGSTDHTPAVLEDATRRLPLTVIRHATPRGRSGASNAGARRATGDILVFLDGDTLAGPGFIAHHALAHEAARGMIGRGRTFHLRGTRFLQDPERGTPRPGEAERLARLAPGELERLRVTRRQVAEDFAAIATRALPGIYPGTGPRRLDELEMAALRDHPDCEVLWAAASGSNLSVERRAFLAAGGFDESLDINEHRELALRLCRAGARLVPVEGACSYHLTHRTGWRDPLVENRWEAIFYRAHPLPSVKLLAIFWAGLSEQYRLPPEMRIRSLPELAAAARGERGIDIDAARRLIPGLPDLAGPAGR